METPVGKARQKGDEVSDNGGTGEEVATGDDDAGENKEQSALQDDATKQKPDIQTVDKQEGKLLSDAPLETEKSPELTDTKKCCKCTQELHEMQVLQGWKILPSNMYGRSMCKQAFYQEHDGGD